MKSTAKPSKNTAQPSTTADPSKAFNLVRDPRRDLGLRNEQKVIEYFVKEGFSLHEQRLRSPFGEIDLIFRTCQRERQLESLGWLLVEVKSQKLSRNGEVPIQQTQIGRLQRAWLWFCGKYGEARFHLVIVDEIGKITIIEDFFTTLV